MSNYKHLVSAYRQITATLELDKSKEYDNSIRIQFFKDALIDLKACPIPTMNYESLVEIILPAYIEGREEGEKNPRIGLNYWLRQPCESVEGILKLFFPQFFKHSCLGDTAKDWFKDVEHEKIYEYGKRRERNSSN